MKCNTKLKLQHFTERQPSYPIIITSDDHQGGVACAAEIKGVIISVCLCCEEIAPPIVFCPLSGAGSPARRNKENWRKEHLLKTPSVKYFGIYTCSNKDAYRY